MLLLQYFFGHYEENRPLAEYFQGKMYQRNKLVFPIGQSELQYKSDVSEYFIMPKNVSLRAKRLAWL